MVWNTLRFLHGVREEYEENQWIRCLQRYFLGQYEFIDIPLFPHGPRPAEVLQKTTRPDDGPTTPGERPGGGARRAETTPGGTGS